MSDTPINDVWTQGYLAGVYDGYGQGYSDGYPKGRTDEAVRLAIHLDAGMPVLTPPEFNVWKAKRDAGPCDDPKCGACTVRREALARQGGDYPGKPAGRATTPPTTATTPIDLAARMEGRCDRCGELPRGVAVGPINMDVLAAREFLCPRCACPGLQPVDDWPPDFACEHRDPACFECWEAQR